MPSVEEALAAHNKLREELGDQEGWYTVEKTKPELERKRR